MRHPLCEPTRPPTPPRTHMKTSAHTFIRLSVMLRLCALTLLWTAATRLPSAEPGGAVVELPRFDVTADRVLPPLEKWHYVSIPGYEIISNASRSTTKRFVREFYLVQQIARILMPRADAVNPLPTYIVICDRGNAFSHFMPRALVGSEYEVRSLFYDDHERTAIIADISPGRDDEEDFSFNLLNEQYFRQIVRRNLGPGAPYWLEEGLCRLLADVQFTTSWAEFGKLKIPGFGFEPVNDRPASLGFPLGWDFDRVYSSSGFSSYDNFSSAYSRYGSTDMPGVWDERFTDYSDWRAWGGTRGGRALIPLKDFFAVKDGTEAARKHGRTYSNQAYLFIHMSLYGRGKQHQQAFSRLVQDAMRNPVTEERFNEAYGFNYRQFGAMMRGYAQSAHYTYEVIKGSKGKLLSQAPAFELRDATEAESGRIAGEVLRLAGQREAALERLIAPYVRGDRTPDLLAALGLTELWAGRTDRARRFLEAAVEGQTSRARAYIELGQLRLQESLAKATAENRRLNDDELTFVIAPLKTGFQYPPIMPEMYQALAQTWFRSATPPSPSDYKVLLGGAYRYPRDLGLIYNLAAVGVVHGYTTESRPLIEHGLQYAGTEEAKKRFSRLAAKLPSPPASATGAAP
jgi:hypothetical protein